MRARSGTYTAAGLRADNIVSNFQKDYVSLLKGTARAALCDKIRYTRRQGETLNRIFLKSSFVQKFFPG